MAVDKGYGSGKSRSAANSRARQRAAAGQMTKGKKGTSATLRKIAKENPVTGFIGGGVIPAKLLKAASVMRAKGTPGFASWAMGQLESRAAAKAFGKENAKRIASGVSPANAYSYASGPLSRIASSGLYPKRVPTKPTTPAERLVDNPRWARPARPKVKPLPIPKGRGGR